jgi:hypothetical protein
MSSKFWFLSILSYICITNKDIYDDILNQS